MISFDKAYETVMASSFRMGTEEVPFTAAAGRVLATEILSDIDMPPFNKATVDGFACRMEDVEKELAVIETIPAGRLPEKSIRKGECSRIMTGAPVPDGADCIIMVEDTVLLPSGFVKFTGVNTKANISFRGEDIKKGDAVLHSGKLLSPQDIAVLASVGSVSATVSIRPIIGIISTGDELVEPQYVPAMSQIRNSNAWQLIAQSEKTGCESKYYGIARDDEAETFSIVNKAVSECDILLLTGGVSMGDFDFVPSVLERAGVKILFSRVRVQPGKPTTFGIHEKCLVFGLPGNPVSSFIQFELLVRPLVYRMMGHEWKPMSLDLVIDDNYRRRSSDRLGFVPVRITSKGKVKIIDYHGSAHINSMSMADAVMSVPEGRSEIRKGEIVHVRQI